MRDRIEYDSAPLRSSAAEVVGHAVRPLATIRLAMVDVVMETGDADYRSAARRSL